MPENQKTRYRMFTVVGFSLIVAFLLAMVIRDNLLINFLVRENYPVAFYMSAIILSLIVGLIGGGFIIKKPNKIRRFIIVSTIAVLVYSIPYFFGIRELLLLVFMGMGFTIGLLISTCGLYLKRFIIPSQLIESSSAILILSSFFAVIVIVVNKYISPILSMGVSLSFLTAGIVLILLVPLKLEEFQPVKDPPSHSLTVPLVTLFGFIFVISINMGLTNYIVKPNFSHLAVLYNWFWIMPYSLAVLVMLFFSFNFKQHSYLYGALFIMIAGFALFYYLSDSVLEFIVIETLLWVSFGIFDLFWWSILSELLNKTMHPIRVFGFGISANVLGIVSGITIGQSLRTLDLVDFEISFLAIVIISMTSLLLPTLNIQLSKLLKGHSYITDFSKLTNEDKKIIMEEIEPLEPLTTREEEILQYLLLGHSNRDIAQELFISENTVKTHVRRIYSKYDVKNRVELISILLNK